MEGDLKIVEFDKYCHRCKHRSTPEIEDPCYECLDIPARPDSHRPEHFEKDESMQEEVHEHTAPVKICDYLYSMNFTSIDYDYAYEYFREHYPMIGRPGACSTVYKDGVFGRNFDWTYDNMVEFVVKDGMVLGVSGGIPKFTNEYVMTHKEDSEYKILPFNLRDGINKYGLACSINVVPLINQTRASRPNVAIRDIVNAQMLVSYILHKCKDIGEVRELICDYTCVYFSKYLADLGYETHYMLADATGKTAVLEFINGRMELDNVYFDEFKCLTNFHFIGTRFNPDNKVCTPADEVVPTLMNNLPRLSSGLERWNTIIQLYNNSNVRYILDALKYTNTYTKDTDKWYTEFVGIDGLTIDSDISEFERVAAIARERYEERTRSDGTTWQTVHSSVYDISNRTLNLHVQEGNINHIIRL